MFENQVMMTLEGSLEEPACLISRRAGVARLRCPRGSMAQTSRSAAVDPELIREMTALRGSITARLARFREMDSRIYVQAMMRRRHVAGGVGHGAEVQAFRGFWGHRTTPCVSGAAPGKRHPWICLP
jgi:hypothetical protein